MRDGPRYEHACSCISHDGGQPRGRRITSPQVMGCNAATCAGSLISRGLPNGKLDTSTVNPCCCYCTSLPLNSSLPLKRSLKMKSARFEKASEEIGVPRGKKSERYRSTAHGQTDTDTIYSGSELQSTHGRPTRIITAVRFTWHALKRIPTKRSSRPQDFWA